MNIIESLEWRYATKKYNPGSVVSKEDLQVVYDAIRLSASSYGLQPYEVIQINSPELREQLLPHSWNQRPIVEASHILLFCNKIKVDSDEVDAFVGKKAKINGYELASMEPYSRFVNSKLAEKSPSEMKEWTAKQTYIALANAMMACASLQIDSTPMEGFEKRAYNQILELTERGLEACVVLAIGYRHEEDKAQHAIKTRKEPADLFWEM